MKMETITIQVVPDAARVFKNGFQDQQWKWAALLSLLEVMQQEELLEAVM